MAVGLAAPGKLHAVSGIELATTAAGIRSGGGDDLVLMTLAEGATTTGVFTQNKLCAAPITLAKQNLANANPRAFLINAGGANAGTGVQGLQKAFSCCQAVADSIGVSPSEVLPFSTGVIGEQLPMAALRDGISGLAKMTDADGWLNAATAIMTTDTIAKGISEQVKINGYIVTLTGIAKGAGMMCPNMATLLSFVATDAAIDQATLRAMLTRAVGRTFNRITVDSDTSTNDAVMLVATGKSGLNGIQSIDTSDGGIFYSALERILKGLATAIIRDAEGASKFVKIEVNNGRSQSDCEVVAYSVAHSPLVKTALFASDPNWGRLVMAIGKSGVESLELAKISITINQLPLLVNGEPAQEYTEAAGKAVFEQEEIEIDIDLGTGRENYHVWTSDLSHDYVSINADYRS